jgi:ketosteroid isomerase-like protein
LEDYGKNEEATTMQRSKSIEALIRQAWDAMRAGDLGAVDTLVSREEGLVWIGTDPAEWWTDRPTLNRIFREQLEALGGSIQIVGEDPQAYEEGSVGWAADRPSFRLPGGTEIPIRVTAVAHREGNEWRFVQWHVSVGVANEEAVGKELPT